MVPALGRHCWAALCSGLAPEHPALPKPLWLCGFAGCAEEQLQKSADQVLSAGDCQSRGAGRGSWSPWWRFGRCPPSSQKSFYNLMTSDKKSEKFFKVLHDRMKKAQQETKSTVSVNMSDIGNKPREDKDEPDPGTKGTGPCPLGRANVCLVG